jgi:hypothetical protein
MPSIWNIDIFLLIVIASEARQSILHPIGGDMDRHAFGSR